MKDRLRETPNRERDLEVRDLIIGARAGHILDDPTFWDYFEDQVRVEPFPTLVGRMNRAAPGSGAA